jgi:hypothetical protein
MMIVQPITPRSKADLLGALDDLKARLRGLDKHGMWTNLRNRIEANDPDVRRDIDDALTFVDDALDDLATQAWPHLADRSD